MRYISSILFLILSVTLKAQQKNIYYPSGFVHYSYDVKNDKLNGEFASYFENGLISAKGSFTNGQKTGKWQAWDSSGILRTSRIYRSNSDFDLLAEWTAAGMTIPEEDIKKRNEQFRATDKRDDIIYMERYWKKLSRCNANTELFSSEFIELLKQSIDSGKITLFEDDRFIHDVARKDVSNIFQLTLYKFLIKEQHNFIANSQILNTTLIGFGLQFINKDGDYHYWIQYSQLEKILKTMKSPGQIVINKLNDQSFTSEIDMTTYKSAKFQPRKVSENEKIILLLREADYEAQAWIYLLNKELMANR